MSDRTCVIEGCGKKQTTRTWCPMHYQRWRRLGTTDLTPRTIADRFWAKVQKTETCWLWTAFVDSLGYGMIYDGKSRPMYASKLAYQLLVGPVPEGYDVDHRCHVHGCVNPAHLQAVTHQKNGENRSGPQSNNSTGVRGVIFSSSGKRYVAQTKVAGKHHYGGTYATLAEAEVAAIALRIRLMTNNLIDRCGVAV